MGKPEVDKFGKESVFIMQLLIDDANIYEIKALAAILPVDGVTTNPSILAKTGIEPFTVLHKILTH